MYGTYNIKNLEVKIMIKTGITSDTKDEFITIDLSSSKHKNRVVDFFEEKQLIENESRYSIRAQWTDDKYHPTMCMSESDFLEFVAELNKWADKIK